MSQARNFLFVTGGSEADLMSDFLQLDMQSKIWDHLDPVVKAAKELRKSSIFSQSTTNMQQIGVESNFVQDGRLLCRSNHTMVSLYVGEIKMSFGNIRHDFRHYLFGGLVKSPSKKQEPSAVDAEQETPKFIPSNDIIEIRTS